jgi:hypothetical protein
MQENIWDFTENAEGICTETTRSGTGRTSGESLPTDGEGLVSSSILSKLSCF